MYENIFPNSLQYWNAYFKCRIIYGKPSLRIISSFLLSKSFKGNYSLTQDIKQFGGLHLGNYYLIFNDDFNMVCLHIFKILDNILLITLFSKLPSYGPPTIFSHIFISNRHISLRPNLEYSSHVWRFLKPFYNYLHLFCSERLVSIICTSED